MTCTHPKSKTLESRYISQVKLGDGTGILPLRGKRRSHECCQCGERWTTYELTADALRNLTAHQRDAQDLRHLVQHIQALTTRYA